MKKSLLCLFCLISTTVYGQLESKGEISFHSRVFENDHQKQSEDVSLWTEARFEVESNIDDLQLKLKSFALTDSKDESRNEFYLEEAYFIYFLENFEISAGRKVLNWSATEAFHPADVFNSRNFDSKVENAQKVGEQLVSLSWQGDETMMSLYYMPFFETPIAPESSNRLSQLPVGFRLLNPIIIDSDGKSSDEKKHDQFALKIDRSFGSADISLQYVDHIDRNQPLLAHSVAQNNATITPYFFSVKHTGLTYQQAINDYVLKIEAAHKDFVKAKSLTATKKDHTQFAFGLDYGFVHQSGLTSTFILEGQRIFGADLDERKSLSLFQNDILLGYKLDFNDPQSTQITLNFIKDLERENETLLSFNTSRRFQSVWVASLSGRVVLAEQKENFKEGLEVIDGSNYLWASLTRYF